MSHLQDLADTAVRHPERATDDARSYALSGHLHDAETDVTWQRSTVDEHPSQLVHPTLTWGRQQETRVTLTTFTRKNEDERDSQDVSKDLYTTENYRYRNVVSCATMVYNTEND